MFAGWNDWNMTKEVEGRKSGYAISITVLFWFGRMLPNGRTITDTKPFLVRKIYQQKSR